MTPRFYAPGIGAEGLVALPDEEAIHLTRVLRLGPGALVTAFDGEGHECLARVEILDRHRVVLRVVARTQPIPESAVRIRLVQAVLKAEPMDAVVRDATMLGIAELQPLITSRVNRSREALRRAGVLERWRRIAIASTKQCGRALVPLIEEARELEEVLAADASASKIILVEPSAGVGAIGVQTKALLPPQRSCTVLVGAEGGWSAGELTAAIAAGFVPITLGRRTLRADAVAVTALAILQFVWGNL